MTGLRLIAAGSLIVVLAASVAVSASARRDAKQPSSVKAVVFRAAADYLGMERRELRQLRRSGRSLVQIAASRGKPVGAFKAALVRATERELPGGRAGDHLDAGTRQSVDPARGEIDELIRQVPARGKRASARLGKVLSTAAARYLRVPENKLSRTIQSGRSLATVATSHKRSVAGLRAALRAAAVAKLDQRVAAGEMNAKKKRKLLARAERKIERLVARAG